VIRAVFENAEVKARLLAMSQVARNRVYRRVLRRNAKPVVNQLMQAWKGARRRSGEITGDIAWAQESRLKFKLRGKGAGMATLEIGTNYKHGGGAKLWHILERGFRHYGKNKTYRTMGTEAGRIRSERNAFLDSVSAANRAQGLGGSQAFNLAFRAWNEQHGEKQAKLIAAERGAYARREDARRGGGRAVAGRWISRPIAQKWAPMLAQKVREDLIAEVLKAARKRPAGVRKRTKPVGSASAASASPVGAASGGARPGRDAQGRFLRRSA
jgi:hypothetical protein